MYIMAKHSSVKHPHTKQNQCKTYQGKPLTGANDAVTEFFPQLNFNWFVCFKINQIAEIKYFPQIYVLLLH